VSPLRRADHVREFLDARDWRPEDERQPAIARQHLAPFLSGNDAMSTVRKHRALNSIALVTPWSATLLVFMVSTAPGRMSEETFTPESLLEAVIRAENERPAVAMDLNITRSTPHDVSGVIRGYRTTWRTDGTRFDAIVEEHEFDLNVSRDTVIMNKRAIWDGQMYTAYEHSTTSGVSTYVVGTGKYAKAPPIRQNKWAAPWADAIPIGDYVSVAQLLASSGNVTLAPQTERIDGFPTRLHESRNARGLYRVWIDPENGFIPRKITILRQANDLHRDGPLRGGTVEIEVSDVEIEKVAGYYVVTKSRITETARLGDVVIESQTLEVKRENIQWNPDFDKMGAFVMDGIPDGAEVRNFDFPGVRYVWADGRPIVDSGLQSLETSGLLASSKIREGRKNVREQADLAPPGARPAARDVGEDGFAKDAPQVAAGRHACRGLGMRHALAALTGVAVVLYLGCRRFRARKAQMVDLKNPTET
jgi:hypothetical protein